MITTRLTNRLRRALQGGSPGVTLIEALVAIVLVAIIAAAFMGALAVAARSAAIADIRTNAESLARSQMEYVKNQDYRVAPEEGEAEYDTISDVPEGYSIWSDDRESYEASREEEPEPVLGVLAIPWDGQLNKPIDTDHGLQRIKLYIKHDGRVVLTLEGYKVDR